jgi:hypothetical protein
MRETDEIKLREKIFLERKYRIGGIVMEEKNQEQT